MPNTERTSKDVELWKKWKRSGSPQDLQLLLKQFSGVMQKEVSRWGGVLSKDVVETEAAVLAKKAFETYDASKGASLSTHVTNALQKLSRLIYSHQNVARLPEYQATKVPMFNKALEGLRSSLGREPSIDEIAHDLAWSQAAVEKMRKELRTESIESSAIHLPSTGVPSGDSLIHLFHHDLPQDQKALFEHMTGYGGVSVLDNTELMKKFDMTQGQVSYAKRNFVDQITKLQTGKKA